MTTLLLLLIACLTGTTVFAADDGWAYRGPIAVGLVDSITCDRAGAGLCYAPASAGGPGSRFFRSGDGGRHWKHISVGSDRDAIDHVLIHPGSGTVLVIRRNSSAAIQEQSRFFFSTDHGLTFQPGPRIPGDYVRIVWNPTNPRILYQVQDTRIRWTQDYGLTWKEMPAFPRRAGGSEVFYWNYGPDVLFFQGRLYAVAEARSPHAILSYVLQSMGNGTGWKIVSAVPEKASQKVEYDEFKFHWDPAFPQRAFLFGMSGIYSFTPGKITRLSAAVVDQLFSVPRHPKKMYALGLHLNDTVAVTNNGARSWNRYDDDLNHSIRTMQALEDTLLAASVSVYRKEGNGHWAISSTGLPAYGMSADSISKSAARLYVIAGPAAGLFRRDLDQPSWTNLSFRYHLERDETVYAVRANPHNRDHVILLVTNDPHSRLSMLVSKDGGMHWRRSSFHSEYYPMAVAFDPGSGEAVYVRADGPLQKSLDGGITGQPLPMNIYADFVATSPFDQRKIYMLQGQRALYVSSDGGVTAQQVGGRSDFTIVRPSNAVPGLLFAAAGFADRTVVLRSTDDGLHWERIGGLNLDPEYVCDHPYLCQVEDLYASPGENDYLRDSSNTLFQSVDAGKHWRRVREHVADMTDMTYSPLFIATAEGVFQRIKK